MGVRVKTSLQRLVRRLEVDQDESRRDLSYAEGFLTVWPAFSCPKALRFSQLTSGCDRTMTFTLYPQRTLGAYLSVCSQRY